MTERETEFATLAEKHFFDQWQEAKKQCDRLRREKDSLEQDLRRMQEMLRIRNARPIERIVGQVPGSVL